MPQISWVCSPQHREVAESKLGWAAGPQHPPGSPQSPVMPPIRWAWGWLGSSPGAAARCCHSRVSSPWPCPSLGGWKGAWTRGWQEGETISICWGLIHECSFVGLGQQLLTALQKLLGCQRGRSRSALSGDGPRQGHSGSRGAAIHPSREHGCVFGAKSLVDEHPRLASNGNQRKGEKTFKASSLPARSRRRRAHTCTHNVLQNF